MIVYYTVYINNDIKNINQCNDAGFQLWLSIKTFRTEWGNDFKIIVYTNNKPFFDIFLDEFENVEIIFLDPKRLRYKDIKCLNDLARFKDTRIYLTSELLNKYKTSVLYCDPDTGILKGSGKAGYEYVKNLDTLYSYCEEQWNNMMVGGLKLSTCKNSGTNWFDGFLFLDRFPETIKDWGIKKESYEHNVGMLYFPYNEFSLKIAKELEEAHEYVISKIKTLKKEEILAAEREWDKGTRYWFNDQIAISLIWNKYKLEAFYTSLRQTPEALAEGKSKLVHYFLHKDHSSKWQIVMRNLKARYSGAMLT